MEALEGGVTIWKYEVLRAQQLAILPHLREQAFELLTRHDLGEEIEFTAL